MYSRMRDSYSKFDRLPVKAKSKKAKSKPLVDSESPYYNTKASIKPLQSVNWAQAMIEDKKKYGGYYA